MMQVKLPDKYFQKRINNLEIKCMEADALNMSGVCEWRGTLSESRDAHYYAAHVHPTGSDANSSVQCAHCGVELESRDELNKHLSLTEGTCELQPIDCIFKEIGCDCGLSVNNTPTTSTSAPTTMTTTATSDDTKQTHTQTTQTQPTTPSLRRCDIATHMSLNVARHLELVYAFVNERTANRPRDLPLMASDSASSRSNCIPAVAVGDALVEIPPVTLSKSSYMNQMSANNSNNRLAPGAAGSSFYAAGNASAAIATSNAVDKTRTNQQLLESKYATMRKKLDILDTKQNNLVDDLSRTNKCYEKLKQDNLQLREYINEYKTLCMELHKTLSLTQVSLLTLEERLLHQEKLSCNGTLLWKITNVHERIQEAKSGRQTSFYSAPFYTDRNGFRMCARIYLNGDGNGRNTHMSLFFVILRGEYDSLLRWPFRQKVTFILIDQSQSESRENVQDAFRPDPNSSSFRRPVSDMNIASGLPIFCPLGKLLTTDHEYIKDNIMFIKIIVDTKDLHEMQPY